MTNLAYSYPEEIAVDDLSSASTLEHCTAGAKGDSRAHHVVGPVMGPFGRRMPGNRSQGLRPAGSSGPHELGLSHGRHYRN